jgi:hypothetical protein
MLIVSEANDCNDDNFDVDASVDSASSLDDNSNFFEYSEEDCLEDVEQDEDMELDSLLSTKPSYLTHCQPNPSYLSSKSTTTSCCQPNRSYLSRCQPNPSYHSSKSTTTSR